MLQGQLGNFAEHLIGNGFALEEAIQLLERAMIERALARTDGNQSAASKLLGIHRNTLQRKMLEYELGGKRAVRKPPRKEHRRIKRSRTG